MNFEKKGLHIALVMNKNEKIKPKLLSLDYDSKEKSPMLHYACTEDEYMQMIPSNKKDDRDVIYCAAKSGAGKSYFVLQYCKWYKKIYPGRPVYIFSNLDKDKTLDQLPGLKRINMKSPEFMSDDFDISLFKKCCVIFDDYDSIYNKKLLKKVEMIQHMILTQGRHTETHCLVCTHNATDGQKTKQILKEASAVVVYPLKTSHRSIGYLLGEYFGFSKKRINALINLKKVSRWFVILETYPNCILYEKGAFLLDVDEYDDEG